jgi:hypothetical protein
MELYINDNWTKYYGNYISPKPSPGPKMATKPRSGPRVAQLKRRTPNS